MHVTSRPSGHTSVHPLALGELARVVAQQGCDRGLHQHFESSVGPGCRRCQCPCGYGYVIDAYIYICIHAYMHTRASRTTDHGGRPHGVGVGGPVAEVAGLVARLLPLGQLAFSVAPVGCDHGSRPAGHTPAARQRSACSVCHAVALIVLIDDATAAAWCAASASCRGQGLQPLLRTARMPVVYV